MATIKPSDNPNYLSFYHGGELDILPDFIEGRRNKSKFGIGLYLTTHYDTAKKYAKGGRKLYMVYLEKGNDISNVSAKREDVISILKTILGKKYDKSRIKDNINFNPRLEGENIPLSNVDILLTNEFELSALQGKIWVQFLWQSGADYRIVDNAFGWHEKMAVVFNLKKIKEIRRIMPKDEIEKYDLH